MKRRIAAAIAAACLTCIAVPITAPIASAAPGASSWGWEQMRLPSLNAVQRAALRDALIASQPAGIVEARRQALALLVTSGTVTQAQADLLAAVNRPSVITALIATGELTKSEGAAVSQVIAGYSRTQARYSAAQYALELLTRTGLLTHAQAEAVRGQLPRIH